MSAIIYNDNGNIIIDEKLIKSIAAESAQETYGIVGLAALNAGKGIFELLRFDQKFKGVDIRINGDIIDVDLVVIMEYGVRIAVVANNVIEKVKYNIENNTKLTVNSVNIIIRGIRA